MRVSLTVTGLIVLLAAGCGRAPEDQTGAADGGAPATTSEQSARASDLKVYDTSGAEPESALAPRPTAPGDVPSPPDVSPDAAPDVAFGYRYSFGLAADQVAPVQQRHARLCEELGAERCRVTGMSYRRSNDDDVRAELRLALEPSLAHRFGERALDGVREAEGSLVDSQVTGTDVGTGIRANTRSIAELEEQLSELQERAERASPATRQNLQAEADLLRARIRALRDDRSTQRETLTTTPMTLAYGSGEYVPGKPDFGKAAATAWDQMVWLGYGLFVLLVVLLPWLLAAGLIWLGVRAARRRRPTAMVEPAV